MTAHAQGSMFSETVSKTQTAQRGYWQQSSHLKAAQKRLVQPPSEGTDPVGS